MSISSKVFPATATEFLSMQRGCDTADCKNKDHSDTLNKCSRCLDRIYCGVGCQTKDWEAGHKEECKILAERNLKILSLYAVAPYSQINEIIQESLEGKITHDQAIEKCMQLDSEQSHKLYSSLGCTVVVPQTLSTPTLLKIPFDTEIQLQSMLKERAKLLERIRDRMDTLIKKNKFLRHWHLDAMGLSPKVDKSKVKKGKEVE